MITKYYYLPRHPFDQHSSTYRNDGPINKTTVIEMHQFQRWGVGYHSRVGSGMATAGNEESQRS